MKSDDLSTYKGKNVLITGHNGFKGSWLTLMLVKLGANVTGLSLAPPSRPYLYDILEFRKDEVKSIKADIKDYEKLKKVVTNVDPDIVFHLAAKPILLESYDAPRDTYITNAVGTLNLLEALREKGNSVKSIVNVTTDKVYYNEGSGKTFREDSKLGGKDPYSSSKSCSELITSAYYSSFFKDAGVGVATARAGNVVGGGDWGAERLIPDIVNAMVKHNKLKIRHPNATRPWQYVLDVLCGYLKLGYVIYRNRRLSGPYNFSLSPKSPSVKGIVDEFVRAWGGNADVEFYLSEMHEDRKLKLDNSKAKKVLGWAPKINYREMMVRTANWYKAYYRREDMRLYSSLEFEEYLKLA